jgi:meiotically up-regulated gene 157 (Mug157) protein
MPTILLLLGWRIFFYANEGDEPAHVHCRKGAKECKYWLDRANFDLEEAYAYNLSSGDRREIKKIIFEHFEYIEQQWDEFQRRRRR